MQPRQKQKTRPTEYTKDSNNTNKTNKTRQDYTGYPSESKNQKYKDETKQDRELPWVPQELSAKNKVQNWFVQQAQVEVKLNKQRRVKLKQTKIKKIPSPPTLLTREQVDGHLCALPTAVLP